MLPALLWSSAVKSHSPMVPRTHTSPPTHHLPCPLTCPAPRADVTAIQAAPDDVDGVEQQLEVLSTQLLHAAALSLTRAEEAAAAAQEEWLSEDEQQCTLRAKIASLQHDRAQVMLHVQALPGGGGDVQASLCGLFDQQLACLEEQSRSARQDEAAARAKVRGGGG